MSVSCTEDPFDSRSLPLNTALERVTYMGGEKGNR